MAADDEDDDDDDRNEKKQVDVEMDPPILWGNKLARRGPTPERERNKIGRMKERKKERKKERQKEQEVVSMDRRWT